MTGSIPDFQKHLLAWYSRHKRDLPWRVPAGELPDPYHVLVSEAMLQQTQVATVIPYFHRFLERFPTLHSLAQSEEQDVLRLWQGLGYYSRARNLRRAAQQIVEQFGGTIPRTVDELLTLQGVGRYTAGAIASLAYETPAPIVDGNVIRVLCRIDKIETDPRSKEILALLWARAEEILPPKRVGDFNSAMMELGATVCTPKNPQCLICPVRMHCEAQQAGVQEQIPLAKIRKESPLERRAILCIEHDGKWLIEQRPANGRWAGMWQFVTIERPKKSGWQAILDSFGVEKESVVEIGQIKHALTHRRYELDVYRMEVTTARDFSPRRWVNLPELREYPLPKPHVSAVGLLESDRKRIQPNEPRTK